MPSPRPRFRVIGKFASAYMPKDYKVWKQKVAEFFTAANIKTGDAAVSVRLQVLVARPKTSKLRFPKPDVDNYAKSVLDAATEAGVWDDDTTVQELEVSKHWAEPDDEPGIHITIREM